MRRKLRSAYFIEMITQAIKLQGTQVKSKKERNVLGVIFDSKLTWCAHVAATISKSKKALFALKLLKREFNATEMRTLLDSNFYLILYYNG